MASYIGKVQIGSSDPVLVGSTLYGICGTAANVAAKNITANTNGNNNLITGDYVNTSYDNLVRGTTIHIKFTQGNEVTSNATLQVGALTTTQPVDGNFTCPANTIISFTLDENQHWVVNDNVDTNTEYVFKTAYNATTNKALTESDIAAAAVKGVVTDLEHNTSSTDLPTAATVAAYVDQRTAGLSGLSGAMHFRGTVAELPDATAASTYQAYDAGDVILGPNNKEYVYDKSNQGAAESHWIELGDEGSYVWKSSQTTDTIDEVTSWTDGTLPQLTVTDTAVSNTTASVSAGILNISLTPVTVGSASGWNAGAMPTLTQTPTTVVVPVANP